MTEHGPVNGPTNHIIVSTPSSPITAFIKTLTDRVHTWHAAEDGGPLHRHGRAHLVVRGAGTRGYPNGHGRRHDIRANAEWRLLVPHRRSFGIGARVKWGTNGSDTTPDLAVHLSVLGDLWLSVGGMIPYRWLERHRPNGDVDYDTRVFELVVAHDRVTWSWWARDGRWSRSDPWWMHQYHRWDHLLLGATDVDTETIETGTCTVPMPEANYPASYSIERLTHRHRRPLGRLRDRIAGPRSFHRTEIRPGLPVPVPGKGENSWDCDDDAIHSTSVVGRSVPEAVGALVASALRQRRAYGGEHMNIPEEVDPCRH